MRNRTYIFIGLAAYIVFLIASIPAAPVIGLLEDKLPFNLQSVSGSVWTGRAARLDAGKGFQIDNIEWSHSLTSILLGRLAYNVRASYLDEPVSARLGLNAFGRYTVEHLESSIPVSRVTELVTLPMGELDGTLYLDIISLQWSPGVVPAINGTIEWNKAAVSLAETARLGDVTLVLDEADDSPLMVRISNKGGDLSLSGDITTTTDGNYQLSLGMTPAGNASRNLVNSLAMFARKQPDGSYMFNNKGNLAQLGFM